MVDRWLREEHVRLADDDVCYFLREYLPGVGWSGGETNQLISNLKKSPLRCGLPDWHYKGEAIAQCAKELRAAVAPAWLDATTIVPMPPSKCRGHAEYDDRMIQVASALIQGSQGKTCELLRQHQSADASHTSKARQEVLGLVSNFYIDENIAPDALESIAVLDDVLTVGRHFRAARTVLQRRYPTTPIIGLFVARRKIVNDQAAADGDPF
jgi:hypothetical protein